MSDLLIAQEASCLRLFIVLPPVCSMSIYVLSNEIGFHLIWQDLQIPLVYQFWMWNKVGKIWFWNHSVNTFENPTLIIWVLSFVKTKTTPSLKTKWNIQFDSQILFELAPYGPIQTNDIFQNLHIIFEDLKITFSFFFQIGRFLFW